MSLELIDRVAIVTGAAQDIGKATARKLGARSARVVGIDIQEKRLRSVMVETPNGATLPLDVTDAGAVYVVGQTIMVDGGHWMF